MKQFERRNGKYSNEEIDFIKRNYGEIKVKEISKLLKREMKSIFEKAYNLNLKSDLTCEGYRVSQKVKKKISLGLKKNYEENPEIKKIIGLSSKKRWADDEYRKKMKNIHKENWEKNPNYKLINSRYKNLRFAKKMNINIAYLLGCLCGDGFIANYINKYKTNQYYIKLGVIDYDFIIKFKQNLEKWINKEIKIRISDYSYLKHKIYAITFHSKKVVIFFNQLETNLKQVVLNSNKKCQIAFLNGLYDSEGSVCFNPQNKYIKFTNTNKNLIDLVRIILKKFQIETHIYFYNNCYDLFIYGKENFYKFHNLFSFSIKRKRENLEQLSKLWRIKNGMD